MHLFFICPHCGRSLRILEEYRGMRGNCEPCGGVIEIPEPTPDDPERIGFGPEWYAVRRAHLRYCVDHHDEAVERFGGTPRKEEVWESVVAKTRSTAEAGERLRLCRKAVNLGARLPWPYARLAEHYSQSGQFVAAFGECLRYFSSDHWWRPDAAEQALALLDRMEQFDKALWPRPSTRENLLSEGTR
jgi:hypothetical protein